MRNAPPKLMTTSFVPSSRSSIFTLLQYRLLAAHAICSQVFKKDYTEFPDSEMVDRILAWAHGSSAEPPSLYSHLLRKQDGLYFIQDVDFVTFLNQYYDPVSKRIKLRYLCSPHCLFTAYPVHRVFLYLFCAFSGDVLPVSDIMMFAPLIPLGQNQAEHNMDENQFETDAWALATEFDSAHWKGFAEFLVFGPDPADPDSNPNSDYPAKHPAPERTLTWVLIMRLLRNAFSHQKEISWTGLARIKAHVLLYMKSRVNFRRLVRCYEACILP